MYMDTYIYMHVNKINKYIYIDIYIYIYIFIHTPPLVGSMWRFEPIAACRPLLIKPAYTFNTYHPRRSERHMHIPPRSHEAS